MANNNALIKEMAKENFLWPVILKNMVCDFHLGYFLNITFDIFHIRVPTTRKINYSISKYYYGFNI